MEFHPIYCSTKKSRLATNLEQVYVRHMTTEEIRRLPVEQKFQIMEVIWEDLRERFERFEISPEHKALLDQRRARVESGESQLLDWDDVKSTIGRA